MEFNSSIFAKYIRSLYKVNLDKTNQVHRILIEAIFKVFVQMYDDIDEMALQICITTATDGWLDLWGSYFGISRIAGESDEKYSERMIAEIIEPKATPNAIKKLTARWLNWVYDTDYEASDITLIEPWKYLLVTSQRGRLSYFGRLSDGEYWTHAVIDIAIPDSSLMSADLIAYLNEIKAAGVQIVWHTDMNWEVCTGYFDSDEVLIFVKHWYDIWVKTENGVIDGIRTACEYTLTDESFYTPLSVMGYLSGRQIVYFDFTREIEWLPFRLPIDVIHHSPIINVEDMAFFTGVDVEELTIQQACALEFEADRQIPNVKYIGKSFIQELRMLLFRPIGILKKMLEGININDLENDEYSGKTVYDICEMYHEQTEKKNEFIKDWLTLDYFNKPINTNPLAISNSVIEILTEAEDKVSEDDLDDALRAKIHTHDNKSVLDSITEMMIDSFNDKFSAYIGENPPDNMEDYDLWIQLISDTP